MSQNRAGNFKLTVVIFLVLAVFLNKPELCAYYYHLFSGLISVYVYAMYL